MPTIITTVRIMMMLRDEEKVSSVMKPYCIVGLGFSGVVTLKTKSRNMWGEIPVLEGM